MQIGWLIGLSASSIVLFFAYFFLSRANYKKRFALDYDIRNHFPYEFNYESKFTDNILGNAALILSAAFALGLFACAAVYNHTNGILLLSLIVGLLYSILFVVINFIPLKYLKLHLLFTVLLFAFSFVTPGAIGLASFKDYQDGNEVFSLIIFIVSMVVAFINFVLVMNPKLTLNIKMQVAKDDKGNEHYIRPKYIVIAMSEWIMIFSLFISQILLILLLVVL